MPTEGNHVVGTIHRGYSYHYVFVVAQMRKQESKPGFLYDALQQLNLNTHHAHLSYKAGIFPRSIGTAERAPLVPRKGNAAMGRLLATAALPFPQARPALYRL